MYRAFKNQSSGHSKAGANQLTADEYEDVDKQDRHKVKTIWKMIEDQCDTIKAKNMNEEKNENSLSVPGWKIVRVFVSSTFADFFNEREVLVKKVFPELSEWCKEKGLKLVECDLRWGVPKDSSTAETILICMEEIDKCFTANQGQPFFITLLGDRYGWIPPNDDVPSQVKDTYDWVDGTSITNMEIIHGAYRRKNPNAGFFVRNSSVYKKIPESDLARFVDENPLSKHHVQVLKQKLRSAFPEQFYDYEVTYKQQSTITGRERVELTGYDGFASDVLEFLKSSISKMYPEQYGQESNIFTKDLEIQWLYVLDQANNLIGRTNEKDILLDFLSKGSSDKFEKTVDSSSSIRLKSDWDICDEDNPVCIVEAPGGWGKTTVLCSVVKEAVQQGLNIFYHIVGSTSSSNSVEFLLRRLLTAINPELSDTENKAIDEANLSQLKAFLRKFIAEFRAKSSETLLIVIDSVNVLDNSNTIDHLSWLPPCLPSNIRCIVSTNQHLPTLSRLYEHSTLKMSLVQMTQCELSNIAVQYLSIYSKKLDSRQLDSLISQSKVDNPLWLTLMAEELRVFGDFSLIDKKILQFPSSMNELLVQIIDRLIAEDKEQGLVKKVLCLTACSVYGLPADNVRQICGDAKTKTEVAQLYWLQTQRLLKPYLRSFGFLSETIKFSHEAVEQAVSKHLLSEKSDIRYWHTILADFYQYWCDDGRLKVFHLPKHLKRAQLHQRTADFMKKDKDSYHYMASWQRSNILRDIRCRSLADPVMPAIAPMMLCHFCALKSRSFSAGCTWNNGKCCVICSNMCQGSKPYVNAHACLQHSGKLRLSQNLVKCVVCNFQVDTKPKSGNMAPSPAILCRDCAFGNGGRICAFLTS